MLLSDSVDLAKKLVKSNVSCKIDVYKGMWHVFQMSPLRQPMTLWTRSRSLFLISAGKRTLTGNEFSANFLK